MPVPWFIAWCKHHAKTFALADEAFLATLASWEDVFVTAGYSADELHAATQGLAMSGRTLARWDHLAAITARIRAARAVEYASGEAKAAQDGPSASTCTLCDGTGYVIVPHPLGVALGEWVPINTTRNGGSYYTAAVSCSCALGRWKQDRLEPKERSMSLSRYAALNPRWQVQLAQHAAELAERAKLARPARG